MDIKIVKEKTPEVKIKKEAEVSIHKKKLISARTEDRTSFHVKDSSDFFGNKKSAEKDLGGKNSLAESQAGKKAREAGLSQRNGRGGAESDGKGSLPAYQKNAAGTMKKTAAKNPVNHNTPLSGRGCGCPGKLGNHAECGCSDKSGSKGEIQKKAKDKGRFRDPENTSRKK